MGSERPVLMNPRDNNRCLLVTAVSQSGREIRLALLKPGESYRPEKAGWSVREVLKPATLTMHQPQPGSPFEMPSSAA